MKNRNAKWYPSYWNDEKHGTAWARVKDAMQRDWIQTKADVNVDSGRELNQNAADTVKQAAGKESIPAPTQPNAKMEKVEWDEIEPAVRYGYGAHQEYANQFNNWDDSVESTLAKDWDEEETGHAFNEVKPYVRRGWDAKQ
jgi:hypothetical protein